ncbi:hypothetical protein CF5_0024 [Staphylococcus phage CF5]|uniref:Uncharacterized protein n=1 Tax=Staphylococcus phage CF5 TaxID=3113739 RepID=A0AAX4J720_9CAUD|nr:hypothetical protein CF5_0024 [Staphylococcus phage CF5]
MDSLVQERITDTYWNTRDLKFPIKTIEDNSWDIRSKQARLLTMINSIGQMQNEFADSYNNFLRTTNENNEIFNDKLDQLLEQKDNHVTKGKILGKLETLEQTDTVKDIIQLVESIQ